MLSDEDTLKLVEEGIKEGESYGSSKLVFCKGDDNKYYIATVEFIQNDPPKVVPGDRVVKYYVFNYAELAVFSAEIKRTLDEDRKEHCN